MPNSDYLHPAVDSEAFPEALAPHYRAELGTCGSFYFFQLYNDIFCIFYQVNLILLGVDFLNRNGAEIGYRVIVLKK